MKELKTIPKFKNEEESLFWDSNDVTEYFDMSNYGCTLSVTYKNIFN